MGKIPHIPEEQLACSEHWSSPRNKLAACCTSAISRITGELVSETHISPSKIAAIFPTPLSSWIQSPVIVGIGRIAFTFSFLIWELGSGEWVSLFRSDIIPVFGMVRFLEEQPPAP
jgi:hypothetical protein